jgi:DnaJ-class molecular chaperone
MTASPSDLYDLLGVAASASVDDIRLAYRRKASQFHPDRNPAADAAARFRDVQAAYELLTHDERRKAYDQLRQKRLLEDPAATARAIFDTYLAEFE